MRPRPHVSILPALAVALLLGGCTQADPSAARDAAGSWDPGAGFERIDCADLALGFTEGEGPQVCFTFAEAGDLEGRVRGALASFGEAAGVDVPADVEVGCESLNAQDLPVDERRDHACVGHLAVGGAEVQVTGDLGMDSYDVPANEAAKHVLTVWVLED